MLRNTYVVHGQHSGMRSDHDRSKREEFDNFRMAWLAFKLLLQSEWHCGMFYYDAKGQQQRLHASEHFTLLKDVKPR